VKEQDATLSAPATTTAHLSDGDPNQAEAHDGRGGLRRTLTTPSIVFMVLAAAAPLTAAAGVLPLSILFSENSAAPVYFIVATVLLVFFAVGYTALSRHVADAGAFYAYIRAGLGRIPGNAAAMLALGAYTLTVVALTVYAGPFASSLVATFTPWTDSPWWLWSGVCWALLALLGYRSIDLSSRVLSALLILEIVVLVILGVGVLVSGGAAGFPAEALNPVQAFGHGAPASGLMWAVLCFVGFEATAVFRGEARSPERTIPRATYSAALLIGVLYVFVSVVIVMGAGSADVVALIAADPAAVLFTLADQAIGPWFSTVINVLLLTSIFACALSFHNVVTRYQLTMGASGLLPKFVGRVHGAHRVPSNASLVLSGLTIVAIALAAVLNLDPVIQVFGPLIGVLGFAVLTMMAFASISAIVYFARPTGPRPGIFVRLIAPIIATFGLLAVLIMSLSNIGVITGSEIGTVLVIALLIALPLTGIVVSVVGKDRGRSSSPSGSAS
jgi:amino acid transporter